MSFEDILNSTKLSTKEIVELLKPQFETNDFFIEIVKKKQEELLRLKQKYPNISDEKEAISIMKEELSKYTKRIVDAIKSDYGYLIPEERIQTLENLLNPENIIIINNPNDEHDFSADPEKGQVVANLSRLAQGKDFYNKIITAKGTLPHEIFHIIIKMLKPDKLADDRMIINLVNGETITSRGMVGFMLNEGFVEKISNEFCERHEKKGENFYHTIAPQYIPYVKLCNYIMNNCPNINYETIFSINYEDCLSQLSDTEKKQYLDAECISYAVRHKNINAKDILNTRIEKVQLDFSRDDRLKKTLDDFSQLIPMSNEQKQVLLECYSNMPDEEIIKNLSENAFKNIGPNSPYYDYALLLIRNYNTALCPSIEEMKRIIDNMYSESLEETTSNKR